MRRRILHTMIAMILAVGLLLGIPLGVVAWWWVSDNANQDLDRRLKSISDQLIRQEGPGGQIPAGTLDTAAFELLLPPSGRLTMRYPESNGVERVSVIGATIEGETFADSIELGKLGTMVLEIPQSQVRDDQFGAVGVVAIAVAASVIAGTVVAAITAGRVADPLTDLAARAAAMARGDFRTEWPMYGISELDRVSRALGDANAEIALRLEREGEIVGDVSHQLRSRLTAIQLRLDELSLHPDPAVVAEAEAGLGQVERLADELDEMVAASRTDPATPHVIEVTGMLNTLVGDFRQTFAARHRTLSVTFDGTPQALSASPGRLREAVSVLVDNALQHGRGDCRIRVDELPSGEMIRITVSDDGDGVPDEVAAHIFRRGFSTSEKRGNGVGLSLARALVEADGGRLDLIDRRPPVFAIVVPSAREDGGGSARRGVDLTHDRVPHR